MASHSQKLAHDLPDDEILKIVRAKRKSSLDTQMERKFYAFMQKYVFNTEDGDFYYRLNAQVPLLALMEYDNVADENVVAEFFKRFANRRIDYVITSTKIAKESEDETLIKLLLELDDHSHSKPYRVKRDLYVYHAALITGLPLLHVSTDMVSELLKLMCDKSLDKNKEMIFNSYLKYFRNIIYQCIKVSAKCLDDLVKLNKVIFAYQTIMNNLWCCIVKSEMFKIKDEGNFFKYLDCNDPDELISSNIIFEEGLEAEGVYDPVIGTFRIE